MAVADLHVHTTNSDGQLSLSAVPGAAAQAGLSAVAITDHDRLHPDLGMPITTREGVELTHGIELRVEVEPGVRVDLLGYGVTRTDALESLVADLQDDRMERGRRIVEQVEARLNVSLDVTIEPGLGRPTIARAIEDSAADYDYQAAFDELIGTDGPCYVSREVPTFETGRTTLEKACAIVGLAHPYRYSDPERALELARSLDAIELYYPYDRAVDTDAIRRLAREADLLVTGGSDAHERTLGLTGLDQQEYDRFRTHLPRSSR